MQINVVSKPLASKRLSIPRAQRAAQNMLTAHNANTSPMELKTAQASAAKRWQQPVLCSTAAYRP